jgi:hypothetical protein
VLYTRNCKVEEKEMNIYRQLYKRYMDKLIGYMLYFQVKQLSISKLAKNMHSSRRDISLSKLRSIILLERKISMKSRSTG